MKTRHQCDLLRESLSHLPKLLPNDSKFARLKRNINKLFLVSMNHPETFTYLKSTAAVEVESKKQVDAGYFVIHPLSTFRIYWSIIVWIVIFVHQMFLSFIAGFFMDLSATHVAVLFAIDIILCMILWTEIFMLFRTGYIIPETNEIILEPTKIAHNYVRHFLPDLLVSLPYALVLTPYFFGRHILQEEVAVGFMSIVYVISIYSFNRFFRYFSCIPNMLDMSETASTIFKTILRFFYLLHWTACFRKLVLFYVCPLDGEDYGASYTFHLIRPKVIPFNDYMRRLNNLFQLQRETFQETVTKYTILNKYTRSILVTLKLALQAGFGQKDSESLIDMSMTAAIMIGGWIYCTYVLILTSNIIFASTTTEIKFQEVMNGIKVFTESKGLSPRLTAKLTAYVERKFQKRFFNEEAIDLYVQSTAECLKKEIMMRSCSRLLTKVPLFKDIPISVLENIVTCLKFEIYFPKEIIIEANAVGDSMYFIAYGTAEVISPTGEIYCKFKALNINDRIVTGTDNILLTEISNKVTECTYFKMDRTLEK